MTPTKKDIVQISLISGKFFLAFLVFFRSIFVYHLNFPHFLKLLFYNMLEFFPAEKFLRKPAGRISAG